MERDSMSAVDSIAAAVYWYRMKMDTQFALWVFLAVAVLFAAWILFPQLFKSEDR